MQCLVAFELKTGELKPEYISKMDFYLEALDRQKKLQEFIRSLSCGSAEYCWLSYEPENEVARKLYSSFGFSETGEMDGEELIAILKL